LLRWTGRLGCLGRLLSGLWLCVLRRLWLCGLGRCLLLRRRRGRLLLLLRRRLLRLRRQAFVSRGNRRGRCFGGGNWLLGRGREFVG